MCQVRQLSIHFASAATVSTAPSQHIRGHSHSIEVPGERAYPESISAAPDGNPSMSAVLASGGIARIKPGARRQNRGSSPAPSTADRHSRARRRTFQSFVGLLERHVRRGSSGTSSIPQISERVRPRDRRGQGQRGLAGSHNLCNDMSDSADSSLYVTNRALHKFSGEG